MKTAAGMDKVAVYLRERFPCLTRLFVRSLVSETLEPLPRYLGMFFALMEAPPATPICFILPNRGNIPRLVAVLYSMICFSKKCPQLIRKYGETNFTFGENVRVLPSGHVYQYGGFHKSLPGFMWLNLVNSTTDRRIVSESEFLPRLEKTTLKRPIGRLDTDFKQPPTALDSLLGTSTFGNSTFFENEVVLLDSRSGFKEFSDSVALQSGEKAIDIATLGEMFPFGQLAEPVSSHSSWIRKRDNRNPDGKPIVTITHSDELLAGHCIDSKERSQLVLVNGLSRIRNWQVYDDVAQMQKLILFADHNEEEMIRTLGQRGCRFWRVSDAEIRMGTGLAGKRGNGIIGEVERWSNNLEHLVLDAEPCECPQLDKVRLELEKLRVAIKADEEGPLAKLVRRAWWMLNDASAVIGGLEVQESKRFAELVTQLRKEIQDNKVWISAENNQILTDVADGLETAFTPAAKMGIGKGEAIERLLLAALAGGRRCVLIARNENQVGFLESELKKRGLSGKFRTYSPSTLPEEGDFDQLICISWLRADLMKHLASSLVAPRITVLAYPFEWIWLNQLKKRMQQVPQVPFISASEKTALVMGEDKTILRCPVEFQTEERPVTNNDEDIWSFEQRLRAARKGAAATPTQASDTIPAHYVSFVGEAYAFLTLTHKVVVATEIVSGSRRQSQALPERLVTDVKQGDFIVFPASGGHELIHENADRLLGSEAVELRKRSRLWRDVIMGSGISPEEFLSKAKELGRSRHIGTIKNWFAYESQIGPREKEDLLLIALVTNSQQLETKIEDVWDAIEKLRSAHLSAGISLRDVLLKQLPQVIRKVEENGTEVDLGTLGSAWVVQVDVIATGVEPRGYGEVNRLLWE